jgi:wyosine [tRNA(Phe)-imidazoG37] synthetase (radical SAM superfamily)
MTEEERPQIVVLNPGVHMTSEQLEKEIEKKRQEEDSTFFVGIFGNTTKFKFYRAKNHGRANYLQKARKKTK